MLVIGKDFHGLTSFNKELLASILLIGALAGPLAAGKIADRIGRRPPVPGTAALFVAGVMLAAFSPSYAAWQEPRRRPRALYQALRTAITDAIQTVPGTGTDRGSCQIAVETAGILATSARNVTGKATDLVGDVGRVLANLHGPRRPASAPAGSDPL